MRSTNFTPQRVALVALLLASTLAVQAQYRNRDDDRRDNRNERRYDDDDHDRYDNGRYQQMYTVRDRPMAPYARPSLRPSGRHIWIEAEWMWRSGRYVYQPGYWTVPRKHMQYVPGYWHRSRGGWIWVQGYWTNARGRGRW
ncbi:hypothetical protein [Phnomibacter ginsenosidimutans]|uniref:BcpO-related WXXGXW repeat protein n=1 Tax=Phnomibacter ginsenosidimutans TaxID=2676868 RepID=A0A6I6GRN6_9BACT|nr:hypothetical protein [Phnomibacter ginsenosidimutans]QGW29622.1 hypothetical protein GLV81_17220 [Phnomibacter ginsenosidimutans]